MTVTYTHREVELLQLFARRKEIEDVLAWLLGEKRAIKDRILGAQARLKQEQEGLE